MDVDQTVQKSLKNYFKILNQVKIHLDRRISLKNQIWAIRSCPKKPLILSLKIRSPGYHWILIGWKISHPSAPCSLLLDEKAANSIHRIQQNSQNALCRSWASPTLCRPPLSLANQNVLAVVKSLIYSSLGLL